MSAPSPDAAREPGTVYRFAGVTVDAARGQLRVGDVEVPCQPLAFRLLVELCRSSGALVPRERLFELLWPEQRVVSDESLTKVVHRLRAALGDAGHALHTVRKLGLRLDAEIETVAPLVSAAAPLPPSTAQMRSSPPAETAEPKSRPRRARWRLAALAAPAAAAALLLSLQLADPVLDPSYDLRRSDFAGESDETRALVALAAEARELGDRARASGLLESAHRGSRSTPLPAALLVRAAVARGDREAARRWAAAARERLGTPAKAAVELFVAYVVAEAEGNRPEAMGAASALLELRPEAWALRLALAHGYLGLAEREAALEQLRRIEPAGRQGRAAALALADRAALGDFAGAERVTRAIELDESHRRFLAGRWAWTRGDAETAVRELDRSAKMARIANLPDQALEAQELAALFAVAAERADAETRLAAIAEASELRGEHADAAHHYGLLAYLAAARDDLARRDFAWERLADPSLPEYVRASAALLAPLVGTPQPAPPPNPFEERRELPSTAGLREALAAAAFASEDRGAEALAALALARERGILRTAWAELALGLEAHLGRVSAAPCKVDPPFPNQLRFAGCLEVERRRRAQRAATAPEAPTSG